MSRIKDVAVTYRNSAKKLEGGPETVIFIIRSKC